MRDCGVLLPVFSLPHAYGIGCFSKEAYGFVDFLAEAGHGLWQILPLGPTGYGDSPYQSFSTFAGNPYFIDLVDLQEKGWLEPEECAHLEVAPDAPVDYNRLWEERWPLLRLAYSRARQAGALEEEAYKAFLAENAYWLEDYALYCAIKEAQEGRSWQEWPDNLKLRHKASLEACRLELAGEWEFYAFIQYIFYGQWKRLKAYANSKGIKIVGDIPIYVAMDSADTWANTQLFQMDEEGQPMAVAGCPPDDFSLEGQLWGNPLYRWERHEKEGFAWWISRMEASRRLYDVIRIDHFRGFDAYWSVPYGAENAIGGHWEPGPGYALFAAIKAALGKLEVIAEDLGFVTKSVVALVKKTGFPGMKILEFAFDPEGESPYAPYRITPNSVVYTGTHDNETLLGWWSTLKVRERRVVLDYLNISSKNRLCDAMIRTGYGTVADTVVIPMQDYLELGKDARINTPATLGGNWVWRMPAGALTGELAGRLAKLAKIYGRDRILARAGVKRAKG